MREQKERPASLCGRLIVQSPARILDAYFVGAKMELSPAGDHRRQGGRRGGWTKKNFERTNTQPQRQPFLFFFEHRLVHPSITNCRRSCLYSRTRWHAAMRTRCSHARTPPHPVLHDRRAPTRPGLAPDADPQLVLTASSARTHTHTRWLTHARPRARTPTPAAHAMTRPACTRHAHVRPSRGLKKRRAHTN